MTAPIFGLPRPATPKITTPLSGNSDPVARQREQERAQLKGQTTPLNLFVDGFKPAAPAAAASNPKLVALKAQQADLQLEMKQIAAAQKAFHDENMRRISAGQPQQLGSVLMDEIAKIMATHRRGG